MPLHDAPASYPAHLAAGSRPWPSTHAHWPAAPCPQMEKGPGATPEPFTMARASISRILSPHVAMPGSAIYLGCRSRGTSISLPAGIGRTALIPPEGGNPGLFGLSARGVYQAALLTHGTGGLLLWAPKRLSRTEAGPPFHFYPPKPWRRRTLPKLQPKAFRPAGNFPFCGTFRNATVPGGAPSR